MTSLQPLAEARRLAAIAEAEPLRLYRQLLGRWDSHEPGDIEKLAEVLTTLGLTDDDVADDIDALGAVKVSQAVVKDAEARVDELPTEQTTATQLARLDRILAHEILQLLTPKRQLLAQRQARIDAETALRNVRARLDKQRQQCARLFGD